MPSQTLVHLQYRNGTYYGQISQNYKKQGKGMLILDTSTVIFADWKDNQIQGNYVYITEGIRAYGMMNNGKLEGYNIIVTMGNNIITNNHNHQNNNNKVKSFYGMYKNGKVYGKGIIIDNQSILLTQYNNNQVQQILSRFPLRQRQLYQLLHDIFPSNLYTLDQFLTQFIKQFIRQLQSTTQLSRFQPCINIFSKQNNQKFYGFQQINKPNKKLGLILSDNQIISIGQHNNNILEGIGRLYENQHVFDGAFKNGKIYQIGIDFHKISNKYILHINDGKENKIQKGFGFPLKQILQFRKQFHLRSIYFYNDVTILGLKNKFQKTIQHLFNYNKRPLNYNNEQSHQRSPTNYSESHVNNRSPSRKLSHNKKSYSPLRQRLSKYELQPDYIQDNNSPIKNTNNMNQYRPIDRASTYFKEENNGRNRTNSRFNYQKRNGEGNEMNGIENNQRRSMYKNSNSNNSNSNGYYGNNINNNNININNSNSRQRYTYNRSNQKYSQDINNKYDQPHPRTSGYRQDKLNQQNNYNRSVQRNSRVTSSSNYGRQQIISQNNQTSSNNKRKHTKDLVKQLQNQQKQRRLTLDEIYEQSGLYGRNYRK